MLLNLMRGIFTALLFLAVAGCGAGGAGTNGTVNGGGTSGSLDTTFGTAGKVITTIGGGANALGIQSDGKIVAAGESTNSSSINDFALVRYLP